MNMLVDFLKFCVKRESESHINPIHIHNNFEKFLSEYQNGNVKDKKFVSILDDIKKAHSANLNRVDESAMDYVENGYNSAKSLMLTNKKNNGYKLNEDEPITKLGSAAFITTAIVLEATLALGLIISLFVLVK